jgi:hypothetical protein
MKPVNFARAPGKNPYFKRLQRAPHKAPDEAALGPLALTAKRMRPKNFEDLPAFEQWTIDKSLGLLDWDGDPTK